MILRSEIRLALVSTLCRLFYVGSRFTCFLILALLVTPAEYGQVAALLIAIEVTRTLIDLGLDNFAVRHFDGQTQKNRAEAKVCFLYKLVVSGCLSIIAAVAIPMVTELHGTLYIVMPMLLPAMSLNAYSFACLQARQSLSMEFMTKLAAVCTAVIVLSILSVALKQPLVLVTSVILGEYAILALGITRAGFLVPGMADKTSLGVLKGVIESSYPLAVSAVISTIYQRFDVLLLGTLGAVAVGTYALVARSAEPVLLMSGALSMAVFAFLSRNAKNPTSEIGTKDNRNELLGTYSLAAVAVATSFAIGWWVALPFLPRYEASAQFIFPVTFALAVRVFNQGCIALMMAAGRFHTIMNLTICNFFVAGTCSVALLRAGGAVGCAWGIAIAETINALALIYLLYKPPTDAQN